jgi:hypothetical protein
MNTENSLCFFPSAKHKARIVIVDWKNRVISTRTESPLD